ncbi:MAG: hypothetical protein ABIS68_00325 [Casimicrobiaceae bacterium]
MRIAIGSCALLTPGLIMGDNRQIDARARANGLALRASFACSSLALCAVSLGSHAVGLGGYEIQSSLGQRLRMVVQVSARADETIDGNCFKVNPFTVASDGLPQLTAAQVTLERGSNTRLIVTSLRPLTDPIIRVSIEVGCDTTLRRDFTLLLDPAPVLDNPARAGTPAAVAGAPAPRPPAQQPESSGAPNQGAAAQSGGPPPAGAPGAPGAAGAPGSEATGSRAASAPGPVASARTARAAQAVPQPASPPREVRAARPGSTTPDAATRPRSIPPAAKAPAPSRDRLSISSAGPLPDQAGPAPITPRLTLSTSLSERTSRQPLPESVLGILRQKQARLRAAPAEEDIPSLEAELVVLQKRTAELRSQLDTAVAQMQTLSANAPKAPAADATTPPNAAAAAAPAATPVQTLPAETLSQRSWFDLRWLLAAALALVIAALIAVLVIWVRRERASRRRQERWNQSPYVPATSSPAMAPQPGVVAMPDSGARMDSPLPAMKTDRPPMPESYALSPFSIGHPANQLGVSDLAQATEKAGVFVTLGRPEKAIDVLRDHVDHEPKPSPMAWLMLLELYRQTGRSTEFVDVAARFHQMFNAETPEWETAADGPEVGLEAFPRVIGHIRRDWPRAEALAFLENLLYDNRGGLRIGFSLPAFRDLLLLHNIVEEYLIEAARPAKTDPDTGDLILVEFPVPPAHLAKAWTDSPIPPPKPVPLEPTLMLDVSLLSDSPGSSALEQSLPIVAEAIVTRWNKPGIADYLTNLISLSKDDRNADLSSEMMGELIMLQDVAEQLEEERGPTDLAF